MERDILKGKTKSFDVGNAGKSHSLKSVNLSVICI